MSRKLAHHGCSQLQEALPGEPQPNDHVVFDANEHISQRDLVRTLAP